MDYNFNETMLIPFDVILDWNTKLYAAMGLSDEDAATTAKNLVMADARGVYSHGICRNTIYYNRIMQGGNNPKGRPEIIRGKGPTVVVQGNNAMGQVACDYAMKVAIEKAREFGSSAVSVTGSNHIGTCASYSMMAADAGMLGFTWTINGGNIMAPWGGCEAQLGNNPFAIAVPCLTKPHVVLDMATSVVARGKILMAMKTKSPIPDNWAFDSLGRPTTDAYDGYWGLVRPAGDYKGYGLTFMNAIISSILSDSSFGPTITNGNEEPHLVQNTGHLLQCVDISAVTDLEKFKKRMDDAVDYLKGGAKSEGVAEIFVPGELEARALDKQMKEGIVYPVEVIEESRVLARKMGVSIPV